MTVEEFLAEVKALPENYKPFVVNGFIRYLVEADFTVECCPIIALNHYKNQYFGSNGNAAYIGITQLELFDGDVFKIVEAADNPKAELRVELGRAVFKF